MEMREKVQFCGHVRRSFGFPDSCWPMDIFHELRALYKLKNENLMSYSYLLVLLENPTAEVPDYAVKTINDCGVYVKPQDNGSCYISDLTRRLYDRAKSSWPGGFDGLVQWARDLI